MKLFDKDKTLAERKKLNKKLIIIGSIVAGICLVLSVFVSYAQSMVTSPNSDDTGSVNFIIESGQGSGDIATNLRDAGLLRNRFIFILYLNYIQAGDNLQAGEYDIPRNLTMVELADYISHGKEAENKITFPEGWTLEKMGVRLEANNVVTKADFLAATKKSYDFDFLKDKPAGVDLEGFLYPDTYIFERDITAEGVVEKMLTNFDKKLTPEVEAKVAASDMNLYQVVTLASVVEREAVSEKDRRLVAGVFLKRLDIGMPLQSDVTVLYALGRDKGSVSLADTQVDSPYNTYRVAGLPLGPVCNPSMEAIEAVLNPTKSDYLYFLAAPDGTVYYSSTVEGHNANKANYL